MGELPLVTVFSFLSTFLYLLNVLSWLIHHFVIKKNVTWTETSFSILQYFREDMILRSVLVKKKKSAEYKILHCFKNQKKSMCVWGRHDESEHLTAGMEWSAVGSEFAWLAWYQVVKGIRRGGTGKQGPASNTRDADVQQRTFRYARWTVAEKNTLHINTHTHVFLSLFPSKFTFLLCPSL